MKYRRFLGLALVGSLGACVESVQPSPPVPPPPPPNQPPVAVAGGPYTTTAGVVQFDGRASSDPDGNLPLTYRWTFGDGASGESAQPSHTYQADGSYDVQLTVTDAKGLSSAPASTTASVAIAEPAVVFTGAGNIADRGPDDSKTAALVEAQPGFVFTLGDNAFPDGSSEDYANYYEPTWGRFKDRTYAVIGNHDIQTDGGEPTFDYFGERAGPRGLGYYSVDLGAWHVIVLNDNIAFGAGSPQAVWLAGDLAANQKRCTLAMWHTPLWLSSNTPGDNMRGARRPLWDALYAGGVDLVLNAQMHHYERFPPMNPAGEPDANGMRQFNVGTGGESLLLPTVAVHPLSEVRAAVFGVLKLTLRADGYDWNFLAVPGESFGDTGSGSCH